MNRDVSLARARALGRSVFWRRLLGVLLPFAAGLVSGIAFAPPPGVTWPLFLYLFGAGALAASLIGGALLRSRWAPLVVSCALVLGILGCIAVADLRFDLAHPAAGVGLSVGADMEVLAIVVIWVGLPSAFVAFLGGKLHAAISRRLSRRAAPGHAQLNGA